MVQPSFRTASSSYDREAILHAAKASPELAGQHDKERWLALYADDAILEDPVGTPASHKGRRPGRLGDELGRFYEAFIAASGIEMVARQDIVSDMHVFRAVDIHTTNLKTGLKMRVPANLLYEIVPRDSGLAIRRMQAHWELNRISRLLMSQGALGIRTIAVMNWSMLRAFGPKWLLAYFKSSQKGVGRAGKERVERLARPAGNDPADSFAPGATVGLPGGAKASVSEFLEGCTSLEVRDLLASGPTVSGLATIEWGERKREAGFVAELDPAGSRVQGLRWFWEA
ncbi:MAG: nuclear transport factor 2 family protein [Myxococcales bacterium]|nr:nuclear transport factor 2 family protein [Myxococcales bacterium]